jgi:hypothetical protein
MEVHWQILVLAPLLPLLGISKRCLECLKFLSYNKYKIDFDMLASNKSKPSCNIEWIFG